MYRIYKQIENVVIACFILSSPLALLTHIVWFANKSVLLFPEMIFGIIGIFVFPVGILHGYFIWFVLARGMG